jgi:hypothetical protein
MCIKDGGGGRNLASLLGMGMVGYQKFPCMGTSVKSTGYMGDGYEDTRAIE